MARVSKAEKKRSNKKIVYEAARLIRENGIESTSVIQVMSAAGLTHGGFYRHFGSKDDLICAAIEKAFGEIASRLEREIKELGSEQAIKSYIEYYLSGQHVHMRGKGCPMAALGAEIGQGPKAYKEAFNQGTEHVADLISQAFGSNAKKAQAKVIGLLAVLVGTMVMARSCESTAMVTEVLEAGLLSANTIISSNIEFSAV